MQLSSEFIFKQFERKLKAKNNAKDKLLVLIDLRFGLFKGKYKGCRFVRITSELSKDEEDVVLPVLQEFKKKFHSLICELVAQLNIKSQKEAMLFSETIYLLMEGASVQACMFKTDAPFIEAKKIILSLL